VDEFMEKEVEQRFHHTFEPVRALVRSLCAHFRAESAVHGATGDVQTSTIPAIAPSLTKFIRHILQHPRVLRAQARLRAQLSTELETFLLAHLDHAADNARRAAAADPLPENRSFHAWVRGTLADHTSCPFAFVFFCCLVSGEEHAWVTYARAAYLAEDLARHLAAMCRQYNDDGSRARDLAEGNLNSLDFPGFSEGQGKERLLWIAEYERAGVTRAMDALAELVDPKVAEMLRVFNDVTDLYGQIYLRKDIGSKVK
jgi:hypothetical protein